MVENFTEEEIKKIRDMSDIVDRDGMSEITNSFSPDVYGYEYIKDAIILQACNRRNKPKQSSTRSKQNILLINNT